MRPSAVAKHGWVAATSASTPGAVVRVSYAHMLHNGQSSYARLIADSYRAHQSQVGPRPSDGTSPMIRIWVAPSATRSARSWRYIRMAAVGRP